MLTRLWTGFKTWLICKGNHCYGELLVIGYDRYQVCRELTPIQRMANHHV